MKHPRMGWRRFVKKREREREEMTIASFLGLISGQKILESFGIWKIHLRRIFRKKEKRKWDYSVCRIDF